jgi:predicted Zn finger-like uncharacterized protein
MSFVTRCTACDTLFKVRPDQLTASDGWVRCSQCAAVFDARAHEVKPLTDAKLSSGRERVQARPRAAKANKQARKPHETDTDQLPPSEIAPPASPHNPHSIRSTPSFVAQAQRMARWRSPKVRGLLSILSFVLIAVLFLQITLHEKDRWAALRPQTQPWLNRLCEYMGCQVQALKQIESITVDAASFKRIAKQNVASESGTQSYRLSLTLKNTAEIAIALPHVELSLQDDRDRPIARRVISPADLGILLDTLLPLQALTASLALQIDITELADQRIQGYRVLAFYP